MHARSNRSIVESLIDTEAGYGSPLSEARQSFLGCFLSELAWVDAELH
jgi:hypothetical protein